MLPLSTKMENNYRKGSLNLPINRDHLPDHLSKMPKALNNEVHALLLEAKKLENSEIVLGRSLKGYDSTFTYSHIHRFGT